MVRIPERETSPVLTGTVAGDHFKPRNVMHGIPHVDETINERELGISYPR
jgi:hypothetical protein